MYVCSIRQLACQLFSSNQFRKNLTNPSGALSFLAMSIVFLYVIGSHLLLLLLLLYGLGQAVRHFSRVCNSSKKIRAPPAYHCAVLVVLLISCCNSTHSSRPEISGTAHYRSGL